MKLDCDGDALLVKVHPIGPVCHKGTDSCWEAKNISGVGEKIAAAINIPFTVGGGIKHVDDVAALLEAGADKISINSAAVERPELINELATEFGSQFVVVAIDTKQEEDGEWYVYTHGGRTKTDIKTKAWAKEIEERGAGEILLTSMNHDGTQGGFAIDITGYLVKHLGIPIIASGGAGTQEHFLEVFDKSLVSAALAASVFHFNKIQIPELKRYLQKKHIAVRV